MSLEDDKLQKPKSIDGCLKYIFRKKYVKLLVTIETKTEFIPGIGTVIVPLAPWFFFHIQHEKVENY